MDSTACWGLRGHLKGKAGETKPVKYCSSLSLSWSASLGPEMSWMEKYPHCCWLYGNEISVQQCSLFTLPFKTVWSTLLWCCWEEQRVATVPWELLPGLAVARQAEGWMWNCQLWLGVLSGVSFAIRIGQYVMSRGTSRHPACHLASYFLFQSCV